MRDLIQQIQTRSIVVPPLGCGNGGLDWAEVRPLLIAAEVPVPDVRAVIFEPGTSTVTS